MVYLHGLNVPGAAFPEPITDSVSIIGPWRGLTLSNTIAATGWRVIAPVMPGDGWSPGSGSGLIYNDLAGDTDGSRFKATCLEFWDHQVWWIQTNISATVPIVPVGGSFGGLIAFLIAINRTSTIAGYVCHHPISTFLQFNPLFSPNVNYTGLNTTAIDITSTALNGITSIPGLLCWGSADIAVGASPWTSDTLTPAIYSAAHGAGAPVTPNCDGTGTSSAGVAENHALTSSADYANPNNDVNRIAAWFTANLPHN